MSTREAQKRRWHRQFILDRAVTEFARHGYEATTMDRIAEAAEVSKGTLYNYFASKQELFASLLQDRFERLFEVVDEVLARDDSIEAKTRALISHFLELQMAGRDIHRLLMAEGDRIALGIRAQMAEAAHSQVSRLAERVAGLIEEGQRQGVIRAGDPMRAAMVVLSIVGAELKYATFVGHTGGIERSAEEITAYILGALGLIDPPDREGVSP